MSKFVKQLVTRDIKKRLENVQDAVLVSTVGMDANTTNLLRAELGKKDINLMVVKNSLGRRACEGSSLAAMFEGASGPVGICWDRQTLSPWSKRSWLWMQTLASSASLRRRWRSRWRASRCQAAHGR